MNEFGLLFKKNKEMEIYVEFKKKEGGMKTRGTGWIRDVTERRNAEERLKASEEKFRSLFEGGPDPSFVLNSDGEFVDVNEKLVEISGYDKEEMLGKKFPEAEFLTEESKQKIAENFDNRMQGEDIAPYEITVKTKGGEYIFAELNVKPLIKEGQIVGEIGTARNITDRKRFEEKIQASLTEKEALLREIHHRVKNNLQIISSLLNMQAMKAADESVVESLLESRSRIHTMSIIHSQLYQSENLELVDMDITIRGLLNFLVAQYAKEGKEIASSVTATGVTLHISQAIPCGLIINELVSNALKHAFKGMTKGNIDISMLSLGDDKVKLSVKDNGVGIPEELDIYKPNTLGLHLVKALTEEQLKGKIGLKKDKGAEIYIEFSKMNDE
jgi:PAS domain S-box-containing protein